MIASVLSFAAVVLSLFLLSVGKSGRGLPGCGANSGCGSLAKGRWSRWLGIPTAALAIPVYLAVLVCLSAGQGHVSQRQQALQVLAIWMAGSAIWFTALQVGLRRYCLYCMLIHACGLVSAGSILTTYPIWPMDSHGVSLALGAAGLAVLIGGQLLLPGKTFAVESSGAIVPSQAPSAVAGPVPKPVTPESPARVLSHRKISLLSGKIVLELDAWPLLGEPTARQVVAWMFDYTCEECHHLHGLLHQALEIRKGTLAVMLLPVPQHSQCNCTIKRDDVEHALACPYTRVGLALWAASPAAYRQWDEFLLTEPTPRPYGLAMLKAKQLADLSRYNFREPDQTLDAQIKAAVDIYQQAGAETIPAVLMPTCILRGHVPDVSELLKIIDKQFRPRPQRRLAHRTWILAHTSRTLLAMKSWAAWGRARCARQERIEQVKGEQAQQRYLQFNALLSNAAFFRAAWAVGRETSAVGLGFCAGNGQNQRQNPLGGWN